MILKNRIGKYLLYAFGEIILVVIGILIALQVNSVQEQRKNTRIEMEYLNGILNNLNQDIYDLNGLIEKDTIQLKAYTLLLNAFRDKSINKKEPAFIKAIGTSYSTHLFTGNSIVFEDMKSSGKINFIQSDVLRFSILEYYNDSKNLINAQKNIASQVITPLKHEVFPDHIDLNSLIEKYIVPNEWRSELDALDLSFFDSEINRPEVKQFANRISILKGYLLASYRENELLAVNAKRLKSKITTYLSGDSVDKKNYLSKEVLNAIRDGDLDGLKKIVPKAALNNCYETKFDRTTLIVVSIYENSLESLTYFVESGADIEQVCENKTALMYAAKLGKLDMLKYLIQQGADINTVSVKGKTALSYSIQYKRPKIEAYLKAQGATK